RRINIAALDDVVHRFGHYGMHAIERRCKQRDPAIEWRGPGEIENMPEQREHQAKLHGEPEEVRSLEAGGVQAAGDEVIDGKRRSDERSPAAVRGQRAECVGVAKDQRDIAEIANVGVGGDGVEIVEMKPIVEMVPVDSRHDCDDGGERQKYRPARQTHADQSSVDSDWARWRKIQTRCSRKLKPNRKVSTRIFERITPSAVAASRIRIPTYDSSAFR